MDTWATSSLSPQIVTGWVDDPDLFARTFPMDLRPQAHEIIRTWLFYTVVRSHYEHDVVPWANAAISGFVVRPRPQEAVEVGRQRPRRPDGAHRDVRRRRRALLGRRRPPGHGPRARRGADEDRPQAGDSSCSTRRASPSAPAPTTAGEVTEPLDRSMLAALADLVAEATAAFDRYDYARALERTEGVLLVVLRRLPRAGQEPGLRRRRRATPPPGRLGPHRARAGAADAARAVRPVPAVRHRRGVVVVAGGLDPPVAVAVGRRAAEAAGADDAAAPGDEPDPAVLAVAAAVLGEVRRAKSEAKRSMRTEVASVIVTDTRRPAGAAGAGRGRRPLARVASPS